MNYGYPQIDYGYKQIVKRHPIGANTSESNGVYGNSLHRYYSGL